MKVCLISAPTANQFDGRAMGETEASRIMGELAPVGILSLAAVLEAKGLQPEVVDLNRVYYDWLQGSQTNAPLKLIFALCRRLLRRAATLIFLASVRFAAVIP